MLFPRFTAKGAKDAKEQAKQISSSPGMGSVCIHAGQNDGKSKNVRGLSADC